MNLAFSIVIMGVAGCGKSSLGAALAQSCGLPLVEGDDFHSTANRSKMQSGVALTDADRAGWLAVLGEQLLAHPEGIVLTCSALKRAYRNQLRNAVPGLRFVFLDIQPEQALQRVQARAGQHFFSTDLVDSQFTTLERPDGEVGVLWADATAPLAELVAHVREWLQESQSQRERIAV